MPPLWPDDRVAKLRQLWGAGLTATECAKRLGISRNAVIGKVNRLDVSRLSVAFSLKELQALDRYAQPNATRSEVIRSLVLTIIADDAAAHSEGAP